MNVQQLYSTLKETHRRFGLQATATLVLQRIGQRLCHLQAIHIVWLADDNHRTVASTSDRYQFRFLTETEVAELVLDPEMEIDDQFVSLIASGRHHCFAAIDQDRVAAYGWYSLQEIEPEHCFGFGMSFPQNAAYMYKGFTHPDYRGQRLHGILMEQARRELHRWGVSALVSTIDWTNSASLKSSFRIGYQSLGRHIRFSIFGRQFVFTPSKARDYGILFKAAPQPTRDRRTTTSETKSSTCQTSQRQLVQR